MPEPHFGHLPFIAGRPFFSFVFVGFFMVRFVLHFTQYAITIKTILLEYYKWIELEFVFDYSFLH